MIVHDNLISHFHKLVHSHSSVHQPGMFSQLDHSVCTLCHMSTLLHHQRRCLHWCPHGHFLGHPADHRKLLYTVHTEIVNCVQLKEESRKGELLSSKVAENDQRLLRSVSATRAFINCTQPKALSTPVYTLNA